MTPRGLITLVLLVALSAIVISGVANWRGAAQPNTAPSVRAQVARSPHARSLGIRQTGSEEIEIEPGMAASKPSYRSSRATANGRPYSAQLDAEPASEQPMMIAREADAVDSTRWWRGAASFGSGSSGDATAASSGAASVPSALVEFIATTKDQKTLKGENFWADLVRELNIVVWWNVAGTTTQRLELFTPNGALYKRLTTTFDADATKQQPSGLAPVETRLPISGTWITEYSLFGAWRVDVYLSGQRTPTTSASFVLNR